MTRPIFLTNTVFVKVCNLRKFSQKRANFPDEFDQQDFLSVFKDAQNWDIFTINIKIIWMWCSVFVFFFIILSSLFFLYISVREDVRCLFVICDWKDVEQLLCLFIKIMIINKLRVTLFFFYFVYFRVHFCAFYMCFFFFFYILRIINSEKKKNYMSHFYSFGEEK